jgi:dienelactone hydrolase
LNLARLGYVTFSTTQNHYEDLYVGVSHQTLMIWNNMRGLDYLESLPDVDRTRIGVAGASGGGLQTQMLTALDPRVKAATIVGLTCDFRQIMFAGATHCTCNHFPNVMRRTDHPEISTLGLPAAVQFLTMNDWTKSFEADNFPTIQQLYAAHGCGERVFCKYFNTEHNYDRTKREYTYWWMERWLRGQTAESPAAEPDTETFPVQTLVQLAADVPGNKGFQEISRIYRAARGYQAPQLATADQWQEYRRRMTDTLRSLLGEASVLPRQAEGNAGETHTESDVVVQRVAYPSEARVVVPAVVLYPVSRSGKLPVHIRLAAEGRESLLAQTGPEAPRELARQGSLVVLPDVRTYGELFSTGGQNAGAQRQAWERNGIVWGRPVPGLAATDLRAVLDGLAAREDVDLARVTVTVGRSGDPSLAAEDGRVRDPTHGVTVGRSGDLSIAALAAMALDARITAADLDFAGACFENRKLPLVSCVLQYGDVAQWAATVADRRLTLRNVPAEAGDPAWLSQAFAAAGNPAGIVVH